MPSFQNENENLSRILQSWEEIDFTAIVVIVVLAVVLVQVVKKTLPWIAGQLPERLRFHVLPWAPILRLVIVALAVVQIVPLVIRPTAENLFALLGATAIAVGFAFKDFASSIIAGVVVLFEKPYRVGDWITVDGNYGEVVALGFRAVTIVTPDDTVVTIPHSKIWDTGILNENRGKRELQCVADFYLGPEHDAEAVRQTLWDVGITSPYLRLDSPVVVVVAERPWATHYRLKAYPIDGRDQFLFISDLTIRGKAELTRLGVDFASAQISAEAAG